MDRPRQINRLRAQLSEMSAALERTLEVTNKGPVMLPTGFRTPAAIRRAGAWRIETWLRNRKVCGSAALAKAVVVFIRRRRMGRSGACIRSKDRVPGICAWM